MTETCAKPSPASPGEDRYVEFEATVVPASSHQQYAVDEAFRLLATWAVRAARGQTSGSDSDLTVRPPQAMNAPQSEQMERTPCQ